MDCVLPLLGGGKQKSRQKLSFLPAFGRGDRTRTCGLLVPNQARYQLRNTSAVLLIITAEAAPVKRGAGVRSI